MRKAELVKRIQTRYGAVGKDVVDSIIAIAFQEIAAGMAEGESLTITGFGRFGVKAREARNGVNPKTGEPITIAARKAPTFKPSAKLKLLLNDRPF